MSPSFLIKIQAPFHQKTLHDLPSYLSSHLSPNRQVLIGSLPLLFCLPALPGWFFLFLSLQSPTQLLRFSLCSSAKKASPSSPSTFGPWCSSLLFIPAPAILYCLTHLPPASLQPFGEGGGELVSLLQDWQRAGDQPTKLPALLQSSQLPWQPSLPGTQFLHKQNFKVPWQG